MTIIDLKVQNMNSGPSIHKLKAVLLRIAGVTDTAIDHRSGHVFVTGDGIGAAVLISALAQAGYSARESERPAEPNSAVQAGRRRSTLSLPRERNPKSNSSA